MLITKLWNLGMLVGGAAAAYFIHTHLQGVPKPTDIDYVSAVGFFAMFASALVSAGGLWGFIVACGLEPLPDGRVRTKQTVLGRLINFVAGDLETHCGMSAWFGFVGSAVLAILGIIGIWVYMGAPINWEALWHISKFLGIFAGAAIAVLITILGFTRFANHFPVTASAILWMIVAVMIVLVGSSFYGTWEPHHGYEVLSILLGLATVAGGIVLLVKFIKSFPGIATRICPRNLRARERSALA